MQSQFSVEHLVHFQCSLCKGWWSIGDAPADRNEWCCPWCCVVSVFTQKDAKQLGLLNDENSFNPSR